MIELTPHAIASGWHAISNDQVVREGGPPSLPVTAQVIRTELGWMGETSCPSRTLRRPQASAMLAIAAVEAAEAAPLGTAWCAGPFGSERWIRRTANGRERWGALAYGRALVVIELPWRREGHSVFVAFVDGVPVQDVDVDPGEPCPLPDPNTFTVFGNLKLAMGAAQLHAYSHWIDEPSTPGVTDGLPGEREPDDIRHNMAMAATVFATVE